MKKLTASGGGTVSYEFAVVPGGSYSLYFAKYPGGSAPTAGTITASHTDEDGDFPILDNAGAIASANLASVEGLAVGFIAHSHRVTLSGTGLTGSDELAASLVATP